VKAVDAELRHIRQDMLECEVSIAGLVHMLKLLVRRDLLLEARFDLAGSKRGSVRSS
jgi:hypothetical protein